MPVKNGYLTSRTPTVNGKRVILNELSGVDNTISKVAIKKIEISPLKNKPLLKTARRYQKPPLDLKVG